MSDRDIAITALNLLSSSRAVSYAQWIEVGMALYNAGCSVDDWIRWHSDGKPNHESTCIQKWNGFAGYDGPKRTIASLIKWARDDSGIDPRGGTQPSTPGIMMGFDEEFIIQSPHSSGWNQEQDIISYAKALFQPGDLINIVTKAELNDKGKLCPAGMGNFAIRYEELIADPFRQVGDYDKEAGVWIRINPLNGKGIKNKDCTEFRHVLVENDDMPVEQQRAIIEQLKLPCSAVVDSGNKSIHALVKIDAGTDSTLYKERVLQLFDVLEEHGFKPDRQCKNPARLSRIPGVMRSGRRQYLIATNTGCASWGEWVDFIERKDRQHLSFSDLFNVDMEAEDDSVVMPRFLTRGGSWMVVAQSGIGKSSLIMQMAVNFALGQHFFSLSVPKPLRCLIIQAENNRLDLAEEVQGMAAGLDLSKAEMAAIEKNLMILNEDTRFGLDFCQWLDVVVSAYMPIDLVILDPLYSYLGCDVSQQGEVTKFLRNGLNPIIHRHGFGCIVVHHTNKVKKKPQDDDYNFEYLGAGSAELTNWARAVSVLDKTGDDPITVNFRHVKRGKRLSVQRSTIHHAREGIFWEEDLPATSKEILTAEKLAVMMPHTFNRKDHKDDDSIHKWCRDNLGMSDADSDRFTERMIKRAVRDQEADRKWTGCFMVKYTDGIKHFQGVKFEDF